MNLGLFCYQNFLWLERKFARLTKKRINIDEGEVSYLIGGQGPVLVLLHGFGANKDNWNKIARNLTKHFKLIIPDIPGFGESFKTESLNYQLEDQLTRLHQFCDALQLERFSMIGNSYGGYLAANYACHFPNKVRRLGLLNPLGVESAQQSQVFENIVLGASNSLLPKSKSELNSLINKCFVQRPFIPDFAVACMAADLEKDNSLNHKLFYQVHHVSQQKITFDQPIEQSLKNYLNPIDVYWGEDDKILHPIGAQILGDNLPNARVNILHSVGHLPMLEIPEKLAQHIIQDHE